VVARAGLNWAHRERTTNTNFGVNVLGYNSSKSALNAVTVAFAKELTTYRIKINAADPSYTPTDFNNDTGYRSLEQATAGSSGWRTKAYPTQLKGSTSRRPERLGDGRLTPI
jgi:NAD(P)-dependent dehydrogenase (short-subunit alcohol dehydrogenase family)